MRDEPLEAISFEIMGEAQAQRRPRVGKSYSGKTVHYDPAIYRDFKQYVKLEASQHKPQELITGPVRLKMTF